MTLLDPQEVFKYLSNILVIEKWTTFMFSSFSSFSFIIIEFSVCPARLFNSALKSGLVNPGLSLDTIVEVSF